MTTPTPATRAAVRLAESWRDEERDGRRAVSHLQGPVPCILATTGSISNGASLFVEHELNELNELGTMAKIFEEECKEGRFEFKPDRSFEERCEIVRRTAITPDMTYEERLAMQKARYGL